MFEATITRRGQITIPADVRKAMGLGVGERVVFTRLPCGTMIMRGKTRSILDLHETLKVDELSPCVPVEAMRMGGSG